MGPYLAGFLEGDGTFFTPRGYRNESGNILYCQISVPFDIQDKLFAEFLMSKLGGTVEDHGTYCKWIVTAFHEVIFIANLVNGYMRTPKIEALHRMIHFLRLYYPLLPVNEPKPLDTSPIDSNAWLSGMWEADGGFGITISKVSDITVGYRVKLKAKIELTTDYKRPVSLAVSTNSYRPILQEIAGYLKVRSVRDVVRHRERGVYYSYVVETSSNLSHQILVSYLSKYPLFSSKYMNYLRWLEVHEMLLKKMHLTLAGFQRCKEIKADFNTNLSPANITWDHLANFYI